MLQEMMQALNDANGVNEDIWFNIQKTVGEKDPSVQCVSCFGGRYYVTEAQRTRLRYLIPFMMGVSSDMYPGLALPAHVEAGPLRCNKCRGPFHPATGHAFSETVVACHVCYGRFAAWQMQKYGRTPLTPKQIKRLNKQKNKAARKAERAAEAQAKQAAKEQAERERLYGKPREARPAQNPTLER